MHPLSISFFLLPSLARSTVAADSRFADCSTSTLCHSLWLWAGHCLITLMFHSSISRNKKNIFEATKFILPSHRLIGSVYLDNNLVQCFLTFTFRYGCCLAFRLKRETAKFPILTWRLIVAMTMVLIPKSTLLLPNPSALTTWAGAQVSTSIAFSSPRIRRCLCERERSFYCPKSIFVHSHFSFVPLHLKWSE